ncbi:aldose 1-epimerase [Aurantibacter sp.]|uniref:aldose epimerase family protein n=1 Tax=Aurantibacter sp. TaxID=2807103 RepID=UPI00326790D6
MEKLVLQNASVSIENGELISYKIADHEFIHQKGSPGWRNADTEMFPIIGPTNEADFQVKTEKGYAIQDQHGLLRELKYELNEQTDIAANYIKSYTANTNVLNSKFPNKSTVENLIWPYDFTFKKQYKLTADGLVITFVVDGEKGMPFMLGYHPAFKLVTEKPTVETREQRISLSEILAVGSRAYQVKDCAEVVLHDKKRLKIKTEGFGNFMLWTEVSNMVCVEPITFYPYAVEASELHKGFMKLEAESKEFKVYLTPEN